MVGRARNWPSSWPACASTKPTKPHGMRRSRTRRTGRRPITNLSTRPGRFKTSTGRSKPKVLAEQLVEYLLSNCLANPGQHATPLQTPKLGSLMSTSASSRSGRWRSPAACCVCELERAVKHRPRSWNILGLHRYPVSPAAPENSHLVRFVFAFRVATRAKRREVAAHESFRLAGPTGLEPATFSVTGRRSMRLARVTVP